MREFYITTKDWAIVKWRYNKRARVWTGMVCNARPGRNKTEAWRNACDATKATRREFEAAGWECQQLIIMGNQ